MYGWHKGLTPVQLCQRTSRPNQNSEYKSEKKLFIEDTQKVKTKYLNNSAL